MRTVGIIGASGYTGAELLRLLASHPEFDVPYVTGDTSAGKAVAAMYPSLGPSYGDLTFAAYDEAAADGLDVVFLALPHGEAQRIVPTLRDRVGHIVDLSADFRLREPVLYPQWYGAEHAAPELLGDAVFGLPELTRAELAGATLVAAAGCYVTAAALALAPLVSHDMVDPAGIVVDAASGVSGAGRSLKEATHFGTVNENFVAYGLLDHRHTPEIEQATGATGLLFTPHLAPMTRGILATCYARPTDAAVTTEDVLGLLRTTYDDEPFVHVVDEHPGTKATLGSNHVLLTARADARTGWIVVVSALDNLVKGASGQAIQCANVAVGIDETSGLSQLGLLP